MNSNTDLTTTTTNTTTNERIESNRIESTECETHTVMTNVVLDSKSKTNKQMKNFFLVGCTAIYVFFTRILNVCECVSTIRKLCCAYTIICNARLFYVRANEFGFQSFCFCFSSLTTEKKTTEQQQARQTINELQHHATSNQMGFFETFSDQQSAPDS